MGFAQAGGGRHGEPSKVKWPLKAIAKFTKFVAVVIFLSTVLTRQSALRSVHQLPYERGDI